MWLKQEGVCRGSRRREARPHPNSSPSCNLHCSLASCTQTNGLDPTRIWAFTVLWDRSESCRVIRSGKGQAAGVGTERSSISFHQFGSGPWESALNCPCVRILKRRPPLSPLDGLHAVLLYSPFLCSTPRQTFPGFSFSLSGAILPCSSLLLSPLSAQVDLHGSYHVSSFEMSPGQRRDDIGQMAWQRA